ncbi:hypothetical protein BS78_10G084900 [Paspalum vaginatum]|nr:hypothetical protein BS78_10G084900 [Paspalum vaginatum]
MASRRRKEGDPPPDYDVGTHEMQFSVEVHHGGFFCGVGKNRSYVDGKMDWWDNIDYWAWSFFWIEEFIMKLGYGLRLAHMSVYWLLPGRDLSDGLRIVSSVINPVADLPDVMSPRKIKAGTERLPSFYNDLNRSEEGLDGEEPSSDSSEDEEDPDFMDSDNDVEDGDDDLFRENVVKAKSKKAAGSRMGMGNLVAPQPLSSGDDTDEELELPQDEKGPHSVRLGFKTFVPNDLQNPTFHYSLKHRVDIKMPRNDRMRVRAHCA